MKVFGPEADAEIAAGRAMSVGAALIAGAPNPTRIWGGYHPITVAGQIFQPIGDRGLVRASGGQLGGAAQAVTLELSGVEPEVLAMLDAEALKNVPVIVWRWIFDASGRNLLATPVFTRGRLDQIIIDDVPGGTSKISASVEGAAKGLGRSRGRTRSDADQRLDDPADAGFSAVSYAGEKIMYWGGKLPSTVAAASGGVSLLSNKYE
ncbi:hypothetical protein [Caulobacter sp. BP25]|uniref:hypothetical protein n=1 Tax=Caulobacter sp. BP25 TaxID=2048900 RepID=UPI000C12C0CA|nr:hypothetical protein [Caulobacter sp. BP25]PHY20931.1 hypothetical protein CSW59_06905 [Caulobacter sp. BP25]